MTSSNIKERRRYFRHPMCFPLSFCLVKSVLKKTSQQTSEVKNISRGGLLFSAKKEAAAGSLIQIKIPFQDKLFKVKAEVAYCRKNNDSGLYDVGVKFINAKETFKVRLIEQMYLISEYRDLRSIELGRDISLQEASREWIKKYSARFNRLYG